MDTAQDDSILSSLEMSQNLITHKILLEINPRSTT